MALYSDYDVALLLNDSSDYMINAVNRSQYDSLFKKDSYYSENVKIVWMLMTAVNYIDNSQINYQTTYSGLCSYLKHKIYQYGTTAFLPLSISSQPTGGTISTGNSIVLSVTASGGTAPYVYQWYLDSSEISGATSSTYTKSGATTSDSGIYYCRIVDSGGSFVITNSVTVTVNATYQVQYGWSLTDPYSTISTGGAFSYAGTVNPTTGADISITVPTAQADNYYFVFKVPVAQTAKTHWYNTISNQGSIPDSVFRDSFVVGSYRYYVSRTIMSIDTSQSLKLTA